MLGVHATRGVIKIVHSSLNNTLIFEQADNFTNSTQNTTTDCVAEEIDITLPYFSLPYRILAGALVVPITICAISGNILVIYVIKHYHSLRITGNVFLASLAVADVGVSTLAMTFYGLQLIQGRWILGPFMCRLWFSCDVLFSTASIMHLACIALDRYLSIVRPFEHERTSSERRRYGMIAGCWFGSALLSFIPIFTGIYTTSEQREKINCLNRVRGRCIFAVNQVYAIVSSSFSFWVPSAIMVIMYVMLIRIADRKEKEAYQMMDGVTQRRRLSQNYYFTHRRSSDDQILAETTPMTRRSHRSHKLTAATTTTNGSYNNHRRQGKHDSIDIHMERQPSVDIPRNLNDPRNSEMKHLRRERRAVKTLGAIMIAFLICWLPFFVRYSACEPNRCTWIYMPIIEDIVFWVGYFNSMINPFLYAFHNKDFRNAFQKTLSPYIVCCRQRRASTCSAIGLGLPPSTFSGEMQKTNSNKQKARIKNIKKNSKTNKNQYELTNINKFTQGKNGLETSNGNITGGDNSTSSKHISIL
ncbi:unnamed protein product [Rotaria sordida]|uniref:G-protein coupled receptors family 1 profile domain-containing protein n=1 Tax=Rotaria sordida TaxID=392033 RepID=A0A814RG57_9BILA|nr:unnamed protein product [Rotaria sordida]CAF1046672.1 unnamed protein product [Rotaria sordida]CAF1131879.1 unnamed protein product [Rotaria sordida]CAF3582675.1 unnamed protein product [Rotaria sordida]CAF3603059.1 unnamed protein product [Rotaria sordida]